MLRLSFGLPLQCVHNVTSGMLCCSKTIFLVISSLCLTDAFVVWRDLKSSLRRIPPTRSSILLSLAVRLDLDYDWNSEQETTFIDDAKNVGNTSSAVSWEWELLASSVFQHDDRPVILFDGQCNLCNGGVNLAIDYDPKGSFRFASLHRRVGKSLLLRSGRDPDDISSIVVCFPSGEAYVDCEAVLLIAQGLKNPLPIVARVGKVVVPAMLREAIYQYISKNRYKFALPGEFDSCRVDFDGKYDDRFVSDPDPYE